MVLDGLPLLGTRYIALHRKNTNRDYDQIVGELKKLRIYNVSRATVTRVLKENGFDNPGPTRDHGSWFYFVQRHAKTIWATDFFTKKV